MAILLMMVASCTSPTDYGGIDAETIAQVKLLDANVSRRGLNVEAGTAWSFLNQRNQYQHLILVRVTEQRLRIDERTGSYPLLEDMNAQVVTVYKGLSPGKTVSLIRARESIPEIADVLIGRKFFLFFDEKMPGGTVRIETGAMWGYCEDLEALMTDPATASFVPSSE